MRVVAFATPLVVARLGQTLPPEHVDIAILFLVTSIVCMEASGTKTRNTSCCDLSDNIIHYSIVVDAQTIIIRATYTCEQLMTTGTF